jgi:glycosyltransferase involved in cell wall biosynthesis
MGCSNPGTAFLHVRGFAGSGTKPGRRLILLYIFFVSVVSRPLAWGRTQRIPPLHARALRHRARYGYPMSQSAAYNDCPRACESPVPLVSVVIPAYNASATIERTIRSVMAQTYEQLQIIVVDDGSSDETASIVERVARHDPRIILQRQLNQGVATARNVGTAHARGKYIAPLDADDIWHPRKLEKQIAVIEDVGDRIGLVYCFSRYIDEDDIVISHDGPQANARGDVYAQLVYSNFIGNASSPLVRRSYLQEVGGYDPALRAQLAQGCEDFRAYLSIAERWEFDLVPEYLVGYRIAAGNMSRNHICMARSWEIVMAEARKRHSELPPRLYRWGAGNFYRWLGLVCLSHNQVSYGLYYLSIALILDPSYNLNTWLVGRLLGPRFKSLVRPIYRRIFRSKYPQSSAWGMYYPDADPAVNDGPGMLPREIRRQKILRSLRVCPETSARIADFS